MHTQNDDGKPSQHRPLDGMCPGGENRPAPPTADDQARIYKDLVETASVLIWQVDADGRFIFLNQAWEKLLGYRREEMLGRKFSEFLLAECAARDENDFVRSSQTEETRTVESVIVGKNGKRTNMVFHATFLRDEAGTCTGAHGSAYDITEKTTLMEGLRRITSLDSLGLLAGGIAHDFNNLLCGILGHVDLARTHRKDPEAVLKHLDKALGVFNRARDLTQQLLSISKGGIPKRKAGRLTNIIKDSAAFALSGSNVRCEFNFERDLWLCEFDENQVGQVINNIVINAQQSMPLGGRIEISARNLHLKKGEIPPLREGRYVRVSVADSGSGIPADMLDRIFDPFFTTKQKGNGLGLSICFSIMRKHDGFIVVDSQQGKGSTFHVYFPASEQLPATNADFCLPHHRGTGRVLIMDDESVIRDVMGQMLASMGYNVVETGDGRETLRYFDESRETGEPISAVFLDLTIPGGMGGKETVSELRKSYPDLPIFASSGYAEDPAMDRPAEFGFTGSIHKPYLITDLADLLNRHLKASQS